MHGLCVLLETIPFSEYHSVYSAPDSRMNRMEGIRFTRNRQNTRSFGKFLAGNPTRPLRGGMNVCQQSFGGRSPYSLTLSQVRAQT